MGRKILRRLLYPHPALLWVLVPAAAALLIYALSRCTPTEPVSVAAYGLSAYTLAAVCARLPALIRRLRRFGADNRFLARYRADVQLRVSSSLLRSLFINGVYGIFHLCLGLRHGSVWFWTLGGYYLLLALIRLLLVRYTRSNRPGENRPAEWRRYRFCGVCLLGMNLMLSVMVYYILWQGYTFRHHPITTIAMAAYTFWALTMAIVNVIRYGKYRSPVYSAAKVTSLASAAVSMLTLETAMLTAFGQEGDEHFRQVMLGCTGTAVVLFVMVLAIHMLIAAHRGIHLDTDRRQP